jgi:hypothetical protein
VRSSRPNQFTEAECPGVGPPTTWVRPAALTANPASGSGQAEREVRKLPLMVTR